MSKTYNTTWNAKRLTVNFNHKQWRQDFAAFIKDKKFWDITRVTKAKTLSNNPLNKGTKSFRVYNQYGGQVDVTYSDDCKIINSNHLELVKEYLEKRGIK